MRVTSKQRRRSVANSGETGARLVPWTWRWSRLILAAEIAGAVGGAEEGGGGEKSG
jgi:hypothetical protein